MPNESDPDWSHLPHAPQAFFGLEEGFSRSELKRAYGRLIRRFKPETHSQEFQRIRAAYETLDVRRSYPERSMQASIEQPATELRKPAPESQSPPLAPAQTCDLDRVLEDPEKAYLLLSKKAKRSDSDYYTLAFLSDLFSKSQDSEQSEFDLWILEGLRCHPDSALLRELSRHYMARHASLDTVKSWLTLMSETQSERGFYVLTDATWQRLARELTFDDFEILFAASQSAFAFSDGVYQNAAYARLWRILAWKAPLKWLDEKFKRINSDVVILNHVDQRELDFLEVLRAYHRERNACRDVPEMVSRLDDFLCDYCSVDAALDADVLLEHLRQLAGDQDELFLFRSEEQPAAALFTPLMMAIDDLLFQFDLGGGDPDDAIGSAAEFLRIIDSTSETRVADVKLQHLVIPQFALQVVLLLSCFAGFYIHANLGAVVRQLNVPRMLMTMAIGSGIVFGLWKLFIRSNYFVRRVDNEIAKLALQWYSDHRKRMFDIFCRKNFDLDQTLQIAEQQLDGESDAKRICYICRLARRDAGLILYSRFQKFVI